MAKSGRIVNSKLSFEALKEVVKDICECGHFSSDHFLNRKLNPTNCAECECPKFRTCYKLTRLPKGPDGKKR